MVVVRLKHRPIVLVQYLVQLELVALEQLTVLVVGLNVGVQH